MLEKYRTTIVDMNEINPSNEDVAYGRFEPSGERYRTMRHALCVAGEQLLKDYAAWKRARGMKNGS